MLDRDPRTKEYMPEPPMVAYSRTRNLKEIIIRLPGHKAQRDFTFLPIEKVVSKDPMVKLARESYWIRKLGTMKENKDRKVIEFGLNLDP